MPISWMAPTGHATREVFLGMSPSGFIVFVHCQGIAFLKQGRVSTAGHSICGSHRATGQNCRTSGKQFNAI
jgi:hypothetical protein